MDIDMTGWLYKCQWEYKKGKKYYRNQIFKKKLKKRYNYCKKLYKNCVIIDYYNNASYKGSYYFYYS